MGGGRKHEDEVASSNGMKRFCLLPVIVKKCVDNNNIIKTYSVAGSGRGVRWWTSANCKPTTTDTVTQRQQCVVCFCASVDYRRICFFFFWLGGRPVGTIWRFNCASDICYQAVRGRRWCPTDARPKTRLGLFVTVPRRQQAGFYFKPRVILLIVLFQKLIS